MPEKITRAKFKCHSVEKRIGFNGHPFVYAAKMQVVYTDSEENKNFFAATPAGTIELSTVAQDVFEPGKEYYVDFILAAVEEAEA